MKKRNIISCLLICTLLISILSINVFSANGIQSTVAPVKLQYKVNNLFNIDAYRYQVLLSDGFEVYSWGTGYFATGSNGEETIRTPRKIENSYPGDIVARGKNHSLVVDDEGSVYGWGSNTNYPMGVQPKGKVTTIAPLKDFQSGWYEDGDGYEFLADDTIAIAAGDSFTVMAVHDIMFAGSRVYHRTDICGIGKNDVGQLGQGEASATCDSKVTIIPNVSDVKSLTAGDDFAVAICGNDVYVWGGNEYGQLGLGHKNNVYEPTLMPFAFSDPEEHFEDIKAGPNYCVGLTNLGNVYTWGKNTAAQLGLGHKNEVTTPAKVNISDVKAVDAGYNHAMAVKTDGTLWTWGYASSGQLGRTTSTYVPGQVQGLSNIQAAVGGYGFTIAVEEDGDVWGFGDNSKGQLGVPDLTISNIEIAYDEPFFNISADCEGATGYEIIVNDSEKMDLSMTKLAIGNSSLPGSYNLKVRGKDEAANSISDWAESNIKICLYGDVNGDGLANQTDAELCMQYFMETASLDNEQLILGDVNSDGIVDNEDAVLIAQYSNGILTAFPVGKVKVFTYDQLWDSPSNMSIRKFGDVDGDGIVTENDAQLCMQFYSGKVSFDNEQQRISDVNNDGNLNSADSILITRYVRGLETTFAAGDNVIFFSSVG